VDSAFDLDRLRRKQYGARASNLLGRHGRSTLPVLQDVTHDHNPNVFYEMAIAHGYHRPCVHIITEGQEIPFDMRDMNTVHYTLTDPDKLESAVTKLRAYATTALENGTTTTLLSAAERFSVVQSSKDPTVEAWLR
jgi:hypothetical protein